MTIKPLGKNILLVPKCEDTTTASGIIVAAETPASGYDRGVVHAIGENVRDVSVGDQVFFKKYAPEEIEMKEDKSVKYLILAEEDVMAIIN